MHARAPLNTSISAPSVANCLLTALDMLELGILLIDHDERIAFANRAAEMSLRMRGALRGHRQATGERHIGTTLNKIRALIKAKPKSTERQITMIKSGGRSLFCLSVPCRASIDGTEIVFVCEPSRYSSHDISPLAPHYGLTRAETRLLQALVKGERIGAYAKRAGITLNTAKGYLQQLFRKTLTTRQSELVQLILGNPILQLVSPKEATE